MDVGAVRLTERTTLRAEREHFIHEQLRAVFHMFPRPAELIAVAGTATSVAAIKLGLQSFEREKINATPVSRSELEQIVEMLYTITSEELSRRHPVITKGRADILPSGALILLETMRYLGLDSYTASVRGLRYGVAIDAIRKARR
jgi:exopolyphosphatase/guanosine-5'-triphosphate,3'-diphosphate pyrophosphatase